MNQIFSRLLVILYVVLTASPLSGFGQGKGLPGRLAVGYSVGLADFTPEKMKYAKSVGIDYMETSINGYINQETLEFKYSDEEIIKRVKKAKAAADEAGIKIWSIHMPYGKTIDISFPDEKERKKVVALHKEVLRYCKILEPRVILFHPSWYLGLNERDIRKNQMIKSAIDLNKEVKRIKAIMVVENMLGPQLTVDAKRERPLCRTVDETLEIMNRLPDNIYSAIDMNHIKNPEHLIRAMGKRLKSVHIADGTGEQENHYFPCSGKGKNNWNEILTALNEVGYTGPFLFESAYTDIKDFADCYYSLYDRVFVKKISQQAYKAGVDSILSLKVFPLLSLLKYDQATNEMLAKDLRLQRIANAYRDRLQNALQQCKLLNCYAEGLKWTEDEMRSSGDALIALYLARPEFRDRVTRLKKSGAYALFDVKADTAALRDALVLDLKGLNRILDVYVAGKRPRYYKIDSISYKPGDAGYKRLMAGTLKEINEQNNEGVFFDASLRAALQTLTLNGREDAAKYVPLQDGLNKEPSEKIRSTDWAKYRYSMILVPGKGPEVPYVKLDPDAVKRCKDAAERYRKGLAPFIVVSGGNVHPFRTPHNEAVEMKKYMVDELKVPADAIFIEPDARHTTTNLRNTSRMIFRFGIPDNKPVLIVTDESQNSYINGAMANTSMRDLGYLPYKDLKKLSDKETEFVPVWKSMHVDSTDPLDP